MVLMSASATAEESASARPAVPASPPASRIVRHRWRDWRLLAGALLVLGSAAAGAALLEAGDTTTTVWAARTTLVPGTALAATDVSPAEVQLDAAAPSYLAGPVPDGYVVTRGVAAGELVPAAAVAPGEQQSRTIRHVAVTTRPQALPGRLSPGDRVDVWVVPDPLGAGVDSTATLVAASVPVASVPDPDSGLGSSAGPDAVVLVLDGDSIGGPKGLDDVTARLVTASAAGGVVLTLDPAS